MQVIEFRTTRLPEFQESRTAGGTRSALTGPPSGRSRGRTERPGPLPTDRGVPGPRSAMANSKHPATSRFAEQLRGALRGRGGLPRPGRAPGTGAGVREGGCTRTEAASGVSAARGSPACSERARSSCPCPERCTASASTHLCGAAAVHEPGPEGHHASPCRAEEVRLELDRREPRRPIGQRRPAAIAAGRVDQPDHGAGVQKSVRCEQVGTDRKTCRHPVVVGPRPR